MYETKKFYRKKNVISDYMPYAAIIEPGIVINKDGSIMRILSYRGPDLDSSTENILGLLTAQLSSYIMTLGSDFSLFFEAQREPVTEYGTDTYFPDSVSKIIDNERQEWFESGTNYQNKFYFTIAWIPPSDNEAKIKEFLIESQEKKVIHAENYIKEFLTKTFDILDYFEKVLQSKTTSMIEELNLQFLNSNQVITYLHSCVSTKHYNIKLPENNILLDNFLYDTPYKNDLHPMLGDKYIAVVSPLELPSQSFLGMFDILNKLPMSYRYCTRFICLDKQDSLTTLGFQQNSWRSKIKSLFATLKELIFKRRDDNDINENAVLKVNEIETAKTLVEGDELSFGYYSCSIILQDDNEDAVKKKAEEIAGWIKKSQIKADVETFGVHDAWLGSLPGNISNNVRHPLISTGNLIHLMPITDVWSGEERNYHLGGPPLIYARTEGNTPFYFNIHVKDVGHSTILGPTGSGKSVFLGLIGAQFRKYHSVNGKPANVFIFDKGGSSKVLTYALGGQFYDLGNESNNNQTISFQPLSNIDDEGELTWAHGWLCDYLESKHIEMTAAVENKVYEGLKLLAKMPKNKRTLTGLIISDMDLMEAIRPLTLLGAYGRVFDANVDTLNFSTWQVFETETLLEEKEAIAAPLLMYLFHKIQKSLDGTPTLILLDECWAFFDNPLFAQKIRRWLKELRRYNASVVFATQSLNDVKDSILFPTIIESCHSRTFLPNPEARSTNRGIYEAFGLNNKQIDIISNSIPKQDYYYTSRLGCRKFDLALGKKTLAFLSTSKLDQEAAKNIFEKHGQEKFADKWLKYKNVV